MSPSPPGFWSNLASNIGQGLANNAAQQSPVMGGAYNAYKSYRDKKAQEQALNKAVGAAVDSTPPTNPGPAPNVPAYPGASPMPSAGNSLLDGGSSPSLPTPSDGSDLINQANAQSGATNSILATQGPPAKVDITRNSYSYNAPPNINLGGGGGYSPYPGSGGGGGGTYNMPGMSTDPYGGSGPSSGSGGTFSPGSSWNTPPGGYGYPPAGSGGSTDPNAGGGGGGSTSTDPNTYSDYGEGMAQGRIVTKPTLARIGEAGPEAVVPLTPRAGNKMQPDILEGHITPPGVPGVRYSRYKSYNRFAGGAGGVV